MDRYCGQTEKRNFKILDKEKWFNKICRPIFNDHEYGGDRIVKGTTFTKYKQFVENCFSIIPRQALHAKILTFAHPRSRKRMSFDSELPDDMKQVIEKWRRYTVNSRHEVME